MENSAEMQAGPFIIKRPSSTDDDAVTTVEILLKTSDVSFQTITKFLQFLVCKKHN